MSTFEFNRTIRTPSSERFLLLKEGKDVAALELHYGAQGRCDGTLIVFEGSGIAETQIPEILHSIDERLLPDVSLKEQNLSFTVVFGRVGGAYQPCKDAT